MTVATKVAADLYQVASQRLGDWLTSLGALPLDPSELKQFDRSNYLKGWKTALPIGETSVDLTILIDCRFPWRSIDTFVHPTYYSQIPHIEKDGYVCALPETAPVDPERHEDVTRLVLRKAHYLLNKSWKSEELNLEFSDEFLSYWTGHSSDMRLRSLCSPNGSARQIAVWRGKTFFLVADSEGDLSRWRMHASGKDQESSYDNGLFLPFHNAPIPLEYPKTAGEFRKIVAREGKSQLNALLTAVSKRDSPLVVVCSLTTTVGKALFAVELQRPTKEFRGPGRRQVDPVQRGFRPNRIPAQIAAMRVLGNAKIELGRVDRFDPSWIHGRDTVPAVQQLSEANAVVLGCGSVGSSVAALLARSGVGKLTIVDMQALESANVGRHELGVDNVGQNKAIATARKLQINFPHMREVIGIPKRWEEAILDKPDLFATANIVVSVMGSWQSEGNLNKYLIENHVDIPIVFGWTEPFAAAGHAVVINRNTGCFACGVDRLGTPKLRVSSWPANTIRREPACGAMFQPYGPIELSLINAHISQTSIDALLGRVDAKNSHRIWCAQQEIVKGNGGMWTVDWENISGTREMGGFTEQLSWNRDPNCWVCGENGS